LSDNLVIVPRLLGGLFNGPVYRAAQAFSQHRSTGFADGHQPAMSPFLRTALLELAHEQTVRQHDEVHVPGLALATAQLTGSHAQFLLAVPMKGLRSRPTIPIDFQNPHYFSTYTVGHQHFLWFAVWTVVPNDYDSHFMVHVGNTTREREVPLTLVTTAKLLLVSRIDVDGQFVDSLDFPFPFHLAVHLQVANVATRPTETILLRMRVVHDFGVGEVTVPGEAAGNVAFANPIDQLHAVLSMILECLARLLALIALL